VQSIPRVTQHAQAQMLGYARSEITTESQGRGPR
jgi:hypothetical protein